MVSMGVKEIFPLAKCDNVLDLMFPSALRCQDSLILSLNIFYAFAQDVDACTCILCFGILILEKTLCFIPNSWFNLINVASSSLTSFFKKFAQADGPLPFFFQHLSFVCPMPKQK
jgi:hypothetical protein